MRKEQKALHTNRSQVWASIGGCGRPLGPTAPSQGKGKKLQSRQQCAAGGLQRAGMNGEEWVEGGATVVQLIRYLLCGKTCCWCLTKSNPHSAAVREKERDCSFLELFFFLFILSPQFYKEEKKSVKAILEWIVQGCWKDLAPLLQIPNWHLGPKKNLLDAQRYPKNFH